MSQRNTSENKRVRRLERALRKGRQPLWLNLIQWLLDHGHAQTKGEAKKLIEEKRVKHESHPLGMRIVEKEIEGQEPEKTEILDPLVPANLRSGIEVVAA